MINKNQNKSVVLGSPTKNKTTRRCRPGSFTLPSSSSSFWFLHFHSPLWASASRELNSCARLFEDRASRGFGSWREFQIKYVVHHSQALISAISGNLLSLLDWLRTPFTFLMTLLYYIMIFLNTTHLCFWMTLSHFCIIVDGSRPVVR